MFEIWSMAAATAFNGLFWGLLEAYLLLYQSAPCSVDSLPAVGCSGFVAFAAEEHSQKAVKPSTSLADVKEAVQKARASSNALTILSTFVQRSVKAINGVKADHMPSVAALSSRSEHGPVPADNC